VEVIVYCNNMWYTRHFGSWL